MTKHIYKGMVAVGLILWVGVIIYAALYPHNAAQVKQTIGMVSVVMMVWGMFGDLSQNVQIHKHTHNNIDKIVIENGKELIKKAVEEDHKSLINRLFRKEEPHEPKT